MGPYSSVKKNWGRKVGEEQPMKFVKCSLWNKRLKQIPDGSALETIED